ncbi:DEAD/DEAH box helicase, partial [Archaeoglobus sp.]
DVIYQAKYEEMVRLKLAAPLKYYRFYVNLTPEEEEKYAAEEGGSNSLSKVQKLMKIAFMAKEKYELLKRIIQKLPEDKILVFCQYIEQAKKAYKAVKEVAKGQVVLLTGETNAKLRKKYFEEFKEGKKRIIVTTTVLDEGIDVPDAETAIILSGTGTERQMIQRIGRVIRYRPNKVAKVIEIVTKNTIEERIADKRGRVLRNYGIKRS